MQKILVTGAAGFIGSSLVDRLLTRDVHVVGIDNFDPFYSPEIKRRNLAGAIKQDRFSFYESDLLAEGELNDILENERPDVVVHLAARTGVRPSVKDPISYAHTNYVATAMLLQAMKKSGVGKLVFGSSSSIYGGVTETPFKESSATGNVLSPYAATKQACEALNHSFHHLYGMSVLNLRFFTVYGPRQRPDLAIHKFARMIDAGVAIPVFGDVSSARDYTYVDDILDGVTAGINLVTNEAPLFDSINLGGSRTITLRDLISTIEQTMGREAIRDVKDAQPGDMPVTSADVSRAQEILGYAPQVSIEQGIANFVKWFESEKEFLRDHYQDAPTLTPVR